MSNGVGETLKFDFLADVTFEKIKIWNGFQRSDEHFTANGRIKSFNFGTASSNAQYIISDTKEAVIIELNQPISGKNFNFKVNEVFAGTKYKDLVVSELCFYGNNEWFTLFSGNYDKRKSELMAKVKCGILEKVINRNFNEQSDEATYREVSFLLRAN